jgi:hypothetical protein
MKRLLHITLVAPAMAAFAATSASARPLAGLFQTLSVSGNYGPLLNIKRLFHKSDGPKIMTVLLAAAAVLVGAMTIGVGTTQAAATDPSAGAGIPAATFNDTQLDCSQDSFAIEYPRYSSPARSSYFAYRISGGPWYTTTYYYFDGTNRWYWDNNGWNPDEWNGLSIAVNGGVTVEAMERRYNANGSGWFWVDLASCFVSAYYGGYEWNYAHL